MVASTKDTRFSSASLPVAALGARCFRCCGASRPKSPKPTYHTTLTVSKHHDINPHQSSMMSSSAHPRDAECHARRLRSVEVAQVIRPNIHPRPWSVPDCNRPPSEANCFSRLTIRPQQACAGWSHLAHLNIGDGGFSPLCIPSGTRGSIQQSNITAKLSSLQTVVS